MSAWVIGLGLSAGYLINKNLQMSSRLEESMQEFQEAAQPADPGPPTSEIRQVQRTVPMADQYQDLNMQDLGRQEVKAITAAREGAAAAVQRYEAPVLPEIEGVYLQFDNHGV
jgi:hypothetical protein